MTPNPQTYLDYAAATPLDPTVYAAMRPYLETAYANPSSVYTVARTTRAAIESSRATVADLIGCKPTEIVFTSGGSEGDNLAIAGVLRAHPKSHWVTTNIEHDAVLEQIKPLEREGHACTVVPVTSAGVVEVGAIEVAITDHTVLVSVMLANNEIGTVQPVGEISRAVRQIRLDRTRRGIATPLFLHTDAVQAANYLSLHVDRLGIDLMSLAGSKIYGPKGSGALYVRTGTVMDPIIYGGGQERGRRSGTENVAAIVGFASALALVQSDRTSEGRWLTELRDDLFKQLKIAIPSLILNGDPVRRLPNNLNFTVPGAEGEGLVLYLDQAGILASTGSACSSGDLDPSHVLLALGRTREQASQSLRLTFGRGTDAASTARVAAELPKIVARLRELGRVQ
ncbi:cysteine desulfurase [Candidatus Saccharibacteria bacterium]|nr:cysteine desulfurase [Candidatus Saccharibacteria bacterium]